MAPFDVSGEAEIRECGSSASKDQTAQITIAVTGRPIAGA